MRLNLGIFWTTIVIGLASHESMLKFQLRDKEEAISTFPHSRDVLITQKLEDSLCRS